MDHRTAHRLGKPARPARSNTWPIISEEPGPRPQTIMTERSVEHSTIVIERNYDASPARVFAAWSTKEALLRWASPGEGWKS